MNGPPKPYFTQALEALKRGDRRGAAALLAKELQFGNTAQKNLPHVAQLAAHIGEIELAIDASKRWAPNSIESLLGYWAMLGTYGRSEEALADIQRQSVSVREHPSVLHVRGTIVNQFGRVEEAQELFRRALAKMPNAMQTWFALSMIKRFTPDDPDLAAMERLERLQGVPPEVRASLFYGLGKAREDCGDVDRAFDYYSKGAGLIRLARPFDLDAHQAEADAVIRDFTAANLGKLSPSGFQGQRSLFVTGLARSGTTLTEQMLAGHSAVSDGAELNVFANALMPLRQYNYDGAVHYQSSSRNDPWGEIARDYSHLVDLRLGPNLIVDKSLGQTQLTGLILHSMPAARIAWLRRNPEDVALSCFRTYFTAGLAWTCSLTDIADYMRTEDRMFAHWREVFPERILVVPYEEMVSAPGDWSERLQRHFGLPIEDLESARPQNRAVRTASVTQVKEPISTSRIGQAAKFDRHLKPFRDRYYA